MTKEVVTWGVLCKISTGQQNWVFPNICNRFEINNRIKIMSPFVILDNMKSKLITREMYLEKVIAVKGGERI